MARWRFVFAIGLSQDTTRASRAAIEAFMKQHRAELWIEHDFIHDATLKKSPAYYE